MSQTIVGVREILSLVQELRLDFHLHVPYSGQQEELGPRKAVVVTFLERREGKVSYRETGR